MLEYTKLKQNRRKFLALTGLTVKEFQALLPSFVEAYRCRYESNKTLAGRKRKRHVGGGRDGRLNTVEQKLLFILVYQKAYPLQVVLGELFGMGQASANEWIHRLLPVLPEALTAMGVMPEREGHNFARSERRQTEPSDYLIDGTERRRQRPQKPAKQALHYSGKKKTPSDKNLVISNTQSKRVGYLSPTYAGKTHDKKLADREHIVYPRQAILHKDTGFQGYEPKIKHCHQPKKTARQRTDPAPQATQSRTVAYPSKSRARHLRYQTVTLCQGYPSQYTSRLFRPFHGTGDWFAQSACSSSQAPPAAMTRKPYFR